MSQQNIRGAFDAPVQVVSDSCESPVAVTSSSQALERLQGRWPTRDGTMYRHARHACVLANEGAIPSKIARKAFVRAAREAGILFETS
ncbi:DUF982 domain-containing protein [Mesorhizobium sp. BH1-1-4]|uniref:DUF982 domain-containing protein n=1 Tax=Mesorhizobium sp. BH1-1-4 TaxID=2876662 RepID=UPI001CD0830A|nr:DUF982 domain-containing protein [Mesorhizobium sp. BH1-1-4]